MSKDPHKSNSRKDKGDTGKSKGTDSKKKPKKEDDGKK